jgi:hypothetical protein
MYKFSMSWFLNIFVISLNKANQLRSKGKTQPTVVILEEEFKLLNSKFTLDERIEILITTFTQEIIRKVTFSVF